MRRQPKHVRILGQRIAVSTVENLMHESDEEGDDHGHRAYGVFDPSLPAIYLDKASGVERTKVTLVHESLHAMLNTSKLDNVEDEEDLVSRLSPVLLDFIRANKGVIAYLQEVQ